MSMWQLAIEQIVFARNYTLGLLEHTPSADWFWLPSGGVSHIGWQVGHLAIAEYRMTLWRIRGKQPEDANLLSQEHIQIFGYDSVPEADPAKYPSPDAVRAVLDRVHEQTLRELRALDPAAMDQPVVHPHPLAKTKVEALLWCAHHEMLHAGQIGLLRRQLGHPPMR
jgi:hypothetical protein